MCIYIYKHICIYTCMCVQYIHICTHVIIYIYTSNVNMVPLNSAKWSSTAEVLTLQGRRSRASRAAEKAKMLNKHAEKAKIEEISFGGIPNSRDVLLYFYKSFWSVLGSQALETPQLIFHELNEPDLAWLLQPSPEPVEPDLAVHQGFLEPSPEPSLEPPVELDLAAPKPPWPSPEPSPEPCWTWPGSGPKPPRPSPEPSPEPCWTWPGSGPKPPRPSPEPSPEPCWTWPGSAPKPPRPSPEPSPEPVEPDLALHQGFQELSPEACWAWHGSAPKPPGPAPEPSEPSPEPL